MRDSGLRSAALAALAALALGAPNPHGKHTVTASGSCPIGYRWNATDSKCHIVTCSATPDLPFTHASCTTPTLNFNTSCVLRCDEGYRVDGTPFPGLPDVGRVCGPNGTWLFSDLGCIPDTSSVNIELYLALAATLIFLLLAVLAWMRRRSRGAAQRARELEAKLLESQYSDSSAISGLTSLRPLPKLLLHSEEVIPFEELRLAEVCGAGGSSVVYRAHWRGHEVAVKQLIGLLDENVLESVQAETKLLISLRHPNIVPFFGVSITPNETALLLVTEYCPGGNLYTLLHEGTGVPRAQAVRLALGAARGLAFLHSRGIVHCDVKSLNCLVASNGETKLCDFGLSRLLDPAEATHTAATGLVGTLAWCSPEVLDGQRPSRASDVYSFAVVLWELLGMQVPYAGLSASAVVLRVARGNTLPIDPQWPEPLQDLLQACWAPAVQRPSMDDVVAILEDFIKDYPDLEGGVV